MKERIWNEIKEFLAVAFVGLLIGVGAGWMCARDIDRDFEQECGLKWNDNGSDLCKEFWKAKGLIKEVEEDDEEN